jgi:hypothetical protein
MFFPVPRREEPTDSGRPAVTRRSWGWGGAIAGVLLALAATFLMLKGSSSGPGDTYEADYWLADLICFLGFPAGVGGLLGYGAGWWLQRWTREREPD